MPRLTCELCGTKTDFTFDGFMVSKDSFKNDFVKSGPNGTVYGSNSNKSAYGHLRSAVQHVADSGSTAKQLLWSVPQRKSATDIYYLAPNVYRVSITGLHAYTSYLTYSVNAGLHTSDPLVDVPHTTNVPGIDAAFVGNCAFTCCTPSAAAPL